MANAAGKYCVLSMDGGGIRGVLTARLLAHIRDQRPHFLDHVDLFAGTSTGSILAVALAKGLPPAEIVSLYQNRSQEIFHQNVLTRLAHFVHSEYTTGDRFNAIHTVIGDGTLGDLPRRVLIATVDLDSNNEAANPPLRSWKAKFYHNYPQDNGGQPNPDVNVKAIDAIMKSSAAPTYFPLYQGFVDGGVVANNPSMCALAQACNPNTGKQAPDDVVLLSLGTGARPEFLTNQNDAWGFAQWIPHLLNLIFDTSSGLAEYQCAQVIAACFHRVNPLLPSAIGLDDAAPATIQTLIDIADRATTDPNIWPALLNWIDTQWLP